MPVSSESFLFRAGAAWQFPAFVICLGSSYLQRMFARLPQLAEAALACPGFEDYCQYLPDQVGSKGCLQHQTMIPCRTGGCKWCQNPELTTQNLAAVHCYVYCSALLLAPSAVCKSS